MDAWLANPAQLFQIKDKTALITGASGAFGALAAKILAGSGANLVLAGAKADALAEVKAECEELGASVVMVARRANTAEVCDALVRDAVQYFGALDIVVTAAGMNDVAKIEEMSLERFEAVMSANVTGSWLTARAAAAQMIRQGQGGKLILMSSARGLLGHPAGYTAYCASKAAIDGITRALGCELGKHGICVNAIAPTVFRSALTAWMFEDSERAVATRNGLLPRIPLGRLGEPEDLAGPLLFLASRASDFYTGHVLYADGGYTAG